MALAQLVVALCILAPSLGNKDIKTDFMSTALSKDSTPQSKTDQQRGESEEKHNRFLRWAFNSPSEEFNTVPFSPEVEEENGRSPWEFSVRRNSQMRRAPPLDKIGGGLVTRELGRPEFEILDSGRGDDFATNRRFSLQHGFIPFHSGLGNIRRKRSDPQPISTLNDEAILVKRPVDPIESVEFPYNGFSGNGKSSHSVKIGPGSSHGFSYSIDSSNKRNFDEIDRAGFHSLGKKNFDEIDRSGFHSLGKKNFDEIDRSGFLSLGKRNFDEIDRAGFHSLGRRNFDEIDKSGFRGFGKRDFDEIDRSGFRDFMKRNFDEIDRSGFRDFGKRSSEDSDIQGLFGASAKDLVEAYKNENKELEKRNFDEISRSGFRSFSKRSARGEKSKSST